MNFQQLLKQLLKLDIKTLIILGLIIILLLRNCGGSTKDGKEIIKVDGKKYELIDQKIDTVFVEKIVKVPTYVPKYITRVETVQVEVPIDVDSLEIVKKYFTTYQVKDTLHLTYDFPTNVTDSLGDKPSPNLGWGVITDKISQNQITSRDVEWNFKIPTIYNTTIVKELPKTQLYYGANIGLNKEEIFGTFSGGLILKTKSDRLYQLNLGVQNSPNGVTPFLGGGLYWKINLKK